MTELLSMLRRYLGSRLGVTIIGLIAICSLIWFAGPRVGLHSVTYRLLIIGLILLGFCLSLLVRKLWAMKKGGQLQKQIQGQDESQAGRQLEVELLKEKMSDAISALKSSELGVKYRGNAALYALPWYMIIGPSASGKSTLLRNSGLHFPFSSQEDLHVKGFGGTRNCDWWFADEAVILDTAGRYTTEDEDQQEWYDFLQLLKKNRPRLPVNGIVVAMSMVDLLTSDSEGVSWHVKVIRERIEELYNQLGFVFPVYLTLTKCDLLKGFEAYFGDISETERRQLWGIDIDASAEPEQIANSIEQQLQALYVKLTQIRLHKLSIERHPGRKADIYDFPEQFNTALPRIIEFIQQLFKENPYQDTPRFCGAFFTSGTQEGKPIERLLGQLKQAFSVVEAEDDAESHVQHETKSYFIKDVFGKVIFPNSQGAYRTRQRLRVQRFLQMSVSLTALIAIVAAVLLYSTSFTSNLLLVRHGENVAATLASNPTTENLLTTFHAYQDLLEYKQQIPLRLRLGLYRGNTQIIPLQNMLAASMHKQFLIPVTSHLQQQLQHDANSWTKLGAKHRNALRGPYYTALKDYLMLGFPARINIAQAGQSLSAAWSDTLSGAQNMTDNVYLQMVNAEQYQGIIDFYLRYLKQQTETRDNFQPIRINVKIAEQARKQLYSPTNANNLYAQLRSIGQAKLPPLSLHDMVQGYGANLLVSNDRVPGIFTNTGWQQYMRPAIKSMVATASHGDWVIDTPLVQLGKKILVTKQSTANTQQVESRLNQEIRALYFSDYADAWFKFMRDIRIEHFVSMTDATKQLMVLANVNGPIAQLMLAIRKNITVDQQGSSKSVPELNEPFAELNKVINPGLKANVSDPIKAYLHELVAVQSDLQRLAASSNQERDAQSYAASILAGSGNGSELYRSTMTVNMTVNRLDDVAARQALKSVLLQPIRESWRTVVASATRGLQQQWQNQVMGAYQQSIAGKFPFDRYANTDAAISDVSNFLQPNTGVLWTFIHRDLGPYLFLDRGVWREQKWLGIGAGFSKGFLQRLTEARQISDGLFGSGSSQPQFSYQLYPRPTPGLSEIILVANGQTTRYHNGPQQWLSLSWPGQGMNAQSQLTAIAAHGLSPDTLQNQGPWSLFHLLAKAQLKHEQGSTYEASWNLPAGRRHYAVRFMIRSNRKNNVFDELLLKQFSLPAVIFSSNYNLG